MSKRIWAIAVAGGCAGAVNGLFGAGGGMVLVPLLTLLSGMEDEEIFPASIAIILPICLITLTITGISSGLAVRQALPYLIGSALGGILAGFFGKRIPTLWLHRLLGALIIWGGVRYLC